MAGYTNFTVVVGGAAIDPTELDTLLADDEVAALATDHAGRLGADGTWRGFVVHDCSQDEFDLHVRPLLDRVAALGAYWRVAQDARDDFEAEWFDSKGRHGHTDAFADVAAAAGDQPTVTLRLTADELAHVRDCVAYRGCNLIAVDEQVAAEEAAVNEAVEGKLRKLCPA